MASNSSWAPNEDAKTLFSERCWLQGAIISFFAYGIIFCLYFLSFYLLVREKNRVEFKKRLPLLLYITVIFLLSTVVMVTLAASTQMAFIDDRNYPGGPSAYENSTVSVPVDDAGNLAFVLYNWLCDALVVWRFKLIYQRCRAPIWVVMLLPCLMLVGSIVLGILFLVQMWTMTAYVANGVNFTMPYLGLSLALNIVLTVAIVIRLLYFRYNLTSVLGSKYGTQYTSIAAMIIESATLYSVMSIAFLVLFGIGNAISQVFLQFMGQFQVIATLLIVFRVAQGKGWTGDTMTYVTSSQGSNSLGSKMRFASGPSVAGSSSGGGVHKSTGEEYHDMSNITHTFSTLQDAV